MNNIPQNYRYFTTSLGVFTTAITTTISELGLLAIKSKIKLEKLNFEDLTLI
jgi:hypothetical protein